MTPQHSPRVVIDSSFITGAAPRSVALLVVLLISLGCGHGPPPEELGAIDDFLALADRFSPATPVVVVPDRFWETRADGEEWLFRGYANLVVHVERQPDAPLEVVLETATDTSAHHFTAMWDGSDLWPAPKRLAEGGEHLLIPRELLTSGLHRLMIRRVAASDDVEHRSQRDNAFVLVARSLGGEIVPLDPAAAKRHDLVRAFLEDAVMGVGGEKLGGWLVEGSAVATATLELAEDSVASFNPVAFDPGPSRFTVVVDGQSYGVDGGPQAQDLEIELSRGSHRLSFEVDGAPDGLFLWGAPHLRSSRRAASGPVVLVTMDTTRWDAMSFHGGPVEATPNIARLAAGASVFENAWATSPWTLPSHASIFTGFYPSHHGAGVTRPRLVRSFDTLAEIYRRSGYRTAGFAGGEMSASHWGVAQGFEFYGDPEGFQTRGDRLTELVEGFVKRQTDGAFFLFVNYFDPHGLYQAPADFEERFGVAELRARLEDVAVWNDLILGDGEAWRKIIGGETEVTEEAVAYMRAAYLAEVAFMDHQIGRLVELFEDRGFFDRATIVLVADHGEFLGEHGFFSHACRLDPELTRVPMIVKWPGQTEGELVSSLVSLVDLFPTIAGSVGDQPLPTDGIPLEINLRDRLAGRDTVLMEEHEMRIHPLFDNMKIAPSVFGFQSSGFQQVVWKGGTFCSRSLPGGWVETRCSVDWRDRLAQLEALTTLPAGDAAEDVEHGLGDEMRRRLEALGYVR
jgi:arylsulfatase A-like enzyme